MCGSISGPGPNGPGPFIISESVAIKGTSLVFLKEPKAEDTAWLQTKKGKEGWEAYQIIRIWI